MFPVDLLGRISFIREEDGSGHFASSNSKRDHTNAGTIQKSLVITGKPAGSKPIVNANFELKKRLLQFSSQPTAAATQQRTSLDSLPKVKRVLGSTPIQSGLSDAAASLLNAMPPSSQGSPSAIDRSTRGKSLSPTNSALGSAHGPFRKHPLKPIQFPLEQTGYAPPVPPKSTENQIISPPPKPRAIITRPSAPNSSCKPSNEHTGTADDTLIKQNRVVPLTKSYRYRFLPGNNGRVILQAFRRRPWWHAISVEKNVDPATETEVAEYDFLWEMYRSAKRYKGDSFKEVCLNHIQYNHSLVTKKGLYFTLRNYCVAKDMNMLDIIPRTFYLHAAGRDDSHIGEGKKDDMDIFLEYNKQAEQAKLAAVHVSAAGDSETKNASTRSESPSNQEIGIVWIAKPASLTNRGFGIQVLRGVDEVLTLTQRSQSAASTGLEQARAEGTKPSSGALSKAAQRRGQQEGWIVQEYLERPLLVSGRKFDIRCFVLLVMTKDKSKDPKLKAYFYEDAYVRTSCKKYSMDKLSDRECHLTNDAVQKHAKGYGKFESGNKLTMEEWQTSLERDYPDAPKNVVFDKILPEIKRLSTLSISAGVVAAKLGKTDSSRSFELLGCKYGLLEHKLHYYLLISTLLLPLPLTDDYMIDSNYKPLLIEVNSNPCLEFACPLLRNLITALIDNTFKTAVDVLCPPAPAGKRTRLCEEACASIDAEPDKFQELSIESKPVSVT